MTSPDVARTACERAAAQQRVLVTGGSGFIGTSLVAELERRGAAVLNLDSAPPRDRRAYRLWRFGDVRDRGAVERALADFRPGQLVHLAARTDLDGETVEDYSANVAGVRAVLDAAAGAGLERAIFASSRMVCRIGYVPDGDEDYDPPNAYGLSKVIGERILREGDPAYTWTLVRPTSIWGPWFDVPYRGFFLNVARGRYVHVDGVDAVKSFGYVGNAVAELVGLLAAPAHRVHRRTFYLADYEPIHVRVMAEAIREETQARSIPTVPAGVLRAGARVGDALKRAGWSNPPLTSFRLANLNADMLFDMDELREVVGELPYGWREGVTETVAWMREAGLVSR